MFTALTLVLCLQQEPAGAGFQEASRIYAQVADRPISGVPTLQSRLETVQKRIDELRQQIDTTAQALVTLERTEMEQTMTIQSSYQGDDRRRRLQDLQSNAGSKRLILEENKKLLEQDLASAIADQGTLQTELGLARAMNPNKAPRETANDQVDERVLDYFRKKAEAIGMPRVQRMPMAWLRLDRKM